MTPDIINNLLSPAGILTLAKVITLIIELIYLVFSFIVVRQVSLMNKGFTTYLSAFFTFLAFAHFFAVVFLVILSLAVL